MQIQAITTDEGFDKLRDEWTRLARDTGHWAYTSSYPWLRTWWDVFAEHEDNPLGFDKRLLILRVSREDELVAIVPLVRLFRKKAFLKITFIEFLGQQWGPTFIDVTGRNLAGEALAEIYQWLLANERFDVLQLSHIPDGTTNVDLSGDDTWIISGCPILYRDRYDDYEQYAKAMHSKRFRNRVRNSHNRLKRQGLSFGFRVASADEKSLCRIARLSKSKLVDGKHSLYQDPDKARFIARVVTQMPSEVEFTMIGEEPASYRLLFHHAGGVFAFDTSYDRRFRDFSVGRLGYLESIKRFFSDAKHAFHCGGPDIGLHKRDHYPDVVKIHVLVRPGNTLLAKLVCRKLRSHYSRVEQKYIDAIKEWSK